MLLPASSSVEPESQERPRSPSPLRDRRYQTHSQTSPRPASAASYCSSSSEVYSSSSSLDNNPPQLAIRTDISPSSQPITIQGTQSRLNYQIASRDPSFTAASPYSSSSKAFSSTSSLNDELSRLVIEHEQFPSSQSIRAESRRSSSSQVFSSTSSLDNQLSQLVIEHDQVSFVQSTATEPHHSRQPDSPRTPSPRPTTSASHYSSSSEALSSILDPQDDVFSQLDIEEETPQSSQSTTYRAPLSRFSSRTAGSSEFSSSSIPTTPVHEREANSPVYGSPSSTGKLTNGLPSPTLSPTRSPVRSPPSSSTRSPRLYRTRSGNLATVAEIRQRREREDELLDIVLRGIGVPGGTQIPWRRRSITMSINESGRWRVDSIWEPWGL